MPVSFLSEEQQRRYGRFIGDPTADHLARYFHLDDADKAFIRSRRGDHMRLGVAVQLGAVRFLGTFLDNLGDTPPRVQSFVGKQIGIKPEDKIATYQASQWRWRHEVRSVSVMAIRPSPSRSCGSVSAAIALDMTELIGTGQGHDAFRRRETRNARRVWHAKEGAYNLSRAKAERAAHTSTWEGAFFRDGSSARVTAPRLLFSASVFGKRPLTVRFVADEVRIS